MPPIEVERAEAAVEAEPVAEKSDVKRYQPQVKSDGAGGFIASTVDLDGGEDSDAPRVFKTIEDAATFAVLETAKKNNTGLKTIDDLFEEAPTPAEAIFLGDGGFTFLMRQVDATAAPVGQLLLAGPWKDYETALDRATFEFARPNGGILTRVKASK